MPSLAKRVLSALIIAGVLAAVIWKFGALGMWAFGSCVCVLGLFEYANLHFISKNSARVRLLFLFVGTLTLFALSYLGPLYFFLIAVTIVFYIVCALWLAKNSAPLDQSYDFILKGIFGILYLGGFPAFALYFLRGSSESIAWFGFLLTSVFAGDTFAYVFGLSFGGPKLMPTVSPNKTISGAIGGIVGSVVAAILFCHYFMPTSPLWFVISAGIIVALIAQSGDLVESLMKRVANVKDSGHFMPGHGGVLDRIDGVILASPIVYLASHIYAIYISTRL